MNTTKKVKNIDLHKKMTSDMRNQAAIITGYSKNYIDKILRPNDKRSNDSVISVCEKLIAAKEETFNKISIEIKRGGVK